MTHPNAKAVREFYQQFDACDADAMCRLYDPEVVFSDPVFGTLRGGEVFAMWRMLTGNANDLSVTADQVEADDHSGSARWQADYTFPKTGRAVRNVIEARFTFRDGKVIRHEDSFSLHRWAGMALGPTGRLLGWLPPVREGIRREAAKSLRAYLREHPAGDGSA